MQNMSTLAVVAYASRINYLTALFHVILLDPMFSLAHHSLAHHSLPYALFLLFYILISFYIFSFSSFNNPVNFSLLLLSHSSSILILLKTYMKKKFSPICFFLFLISSLILGWWTNIYSSTVQSVFVTLITSLTPITFLFELTPSFKSLFFCIILQYKRNL